MFLAWLEVKKGNLSGFQDKFFSYTFILEFVLCVNKPVIIRLTLHRLPFLEDKDFFINEKFC